MHVKCIYNRVSPMADITQLILSKYYGFGANPENKKFLSSHDGTYDRSNYQQRSYSSDPSGTETTEVAYGRGTSSETKKDEMENFNLGESPGNRIIRSSRVIPDDDTLDDEDNDHVNEYEAMVKSPDCRTDRLASEENKISDEKDLTVKLERNYDRDEVIRNDSTLGYLEDIVPDNVSDISSIPTKKKLKKKSLLTTSSSTVSSDPPPPPRKLSACNGVFLDLTNLSLTEFPANMLTNLRNLRMLYLENNSLTTLPGELFSSLKLLQWLDMRNNKLSTLPKSIKYHTCLETILLEGNLFEQLPLELCLLPNLKGLQTSRNPLVFPPTDILALGFAATINCLRSEWNKLNPEEAVESPERDIKTKSSTILCSDPPILRKISKSSRIFGSSSTGRVAEGTRKISVREKSRNYRPSNRYEISNIKINSLDENSLDRHHILQKETEHVLCDSCAKNTEIAVSHEEISAEADLYTMIKPSKIKLPKIDPKKCAFRTSSTIQAKERVFDIITNDRTMEKLCPMRLNDPEQMLTFLENYLGIKKRTMGWFPPR